MLLSKEKGDVLDRKMYIGMWMPNEEYRNYWFRICNPIVDLGLSEYCQSESRSIFIIEPIGGVRGVENPMFCLNVSYGIPYCRQMVKMYIDLSLVATDKLLVYNETGSLYAWEYK